MYTSSLRKVGGSVMLTVPPAILDSLKLTAGTMVALEVDQGRLVIEAKTRPQYTLGELLSQCDFSLEESEEDNAWIDSKPVGSELI